MNTLLIFALELRSPSLPLTILMSSNAEISLRRNQTTISLNYLWKDWLEIFDERRYTQTPLTTNRFFCYFPLNKKPIFYYQVKMQPNFPKHDLVSCWFFQQKWEEQQCTAAPHLTKTAEVPWCLSSCCFIESSLYKTHYPCIILLVSSSSPASSLPQVATAGPELKFSCAIDPVTSPLNCTTSIQFAVYSEIPLFLSIIVLSALYLVIISLLLSLCYLFKIRK